VRWDITTAGISAQSPRVLTAILQAGYTGASVTQAVVFQNSVAGTNTGYAGGNIGIQTASVAITTGYNTGHLANAGNGDRNFGIIGRAATSKNNAVNVGVWGVGLNAGTTPTQIGGLFTLADTFPTFESAALIADNGATTSPIFLARDNGTKVFEIRDGAIVVINDTAGSTITTFSPSITTSANFVRVVGSMPAVPAGDVYALYASITSAGSAAQRNGGMNIDYLGGYTGSRETIGLRVVNAAAGTGSNVFSNLANYGVFGGATSTTSGTNVGFVGVATNGNASTGVLGIAVTAKNNATNIGVVGFGLNAGTTPIQIGGYFGLQSSTPTFESAALISDNGATTSPIFLARDNGTIVFRIADGGTTTIQSGVNINIALVVKGASPQTVNLMEWQSNSGTVLSSMNGSGWLSIGSNAEANGSLMVRPTGNSVIGITVRALSSQSANLQEWQSSAAAIYGTISENGYYTTRKTSAPADAELTAGEAAWWFDSSNGASKLMVKAKSADGTVVTGSLALA
jgi:hypothetical protein